MIVLVIAHDFAKALDDRKQSLNQIPLKAIKWLILDFSKPFDRVPHQRLLINFPDMTFLPFTVSHHFKIFIYIYRPVYGVVEIISLRKVYNLRKVLRSSACAQT